MKKIIFIKETAVDSRNYSKVILPYTKDAIATVSSIASYYETEESTDVSSLIINQILASAISDRNSTSVYVVYSDNLVSRANMYSFNTVRHFVNKRKEHGDRFLYIGNDKSSKLIAGLWGFRQLKPPQNTYCMATLPNSSKERRV